MRALSLKIAAQSCLRVGMILATAIAVVPHSMRAEPVDHQDGISKPKEENKIGAIEDVLKQLITPGAKSTFDTPGIGREIDALPEPAENPKKIEKNQMVNPADEFSDPSTKLTSQQKDKLVQPAPSESNLRPIDELIDDTGTNAPPPIVEPHQNTPTKRNPIARKELHPTRIVSDARSSGGSSFEDVCKLLEQKLIDTSSDVQVEEPVRRFLTRALRREAWREFEMKWKDTDMIKQLLEDVGDPNLLVQTKLDYPMGELVADIMKHFECVESQTSESWTEKYIEFVDNLNKRQIEGRDYRDLVSSIGSSIEKLISLTLRVRTIKDVFKQNLEGVSSGVLVLGRVKGKIDDLDQRPDDVFASIEEGAKEFLKLHGVKRFIMSDISVAGKRFTNTITRFSSAKIEPAGTDPIYHNYLGNYYVIQRYRIFPVFQRRSSHESTSQTNSRDGSLPAAGETTRYWAVNSVNHEKLPESDSVRKFVAEMLRQVETDEKTSRERITGFEGKYASNLQEIRQKISEEGSRLRAEVQNVVAAIASIDPGYSGAKITENLDAFLTATDDKIENMRAEWGPTIEAELSDADDLFTTLIANARAAFEDHISSRTMTIFTKEDGVQGPSDSLRELRQKLIEKAHKNLNGRKASLVSYRVSVIKDNKLESEDADQYYDRGRVRKSVLLTPILRNVGGLRQGTQQKMEVLLLQEVQFSKRTGEYSEGSGSTSAVSQNRPRASDQEIFADVANSLEWYLPLKSECWGRLESDVQMPVKYEIPALADLTKLSRYLNSEENRDTRALFPYLLDQDNYIWAKRARSGLQDEYQTYNLLTNETSFEPADSCNYVVGVRRFG